MHSYLFFAVEILGAPFRGFLVQARPHAPVFPTPNFPLGGFDFIFEGLYQLIGCDFGKGNTATHTDAEVKTHVSIPWFSFGPDGDIEFRSVKFIIYLLMVYFLSYIVSNLWLRNIYSCLFESFYF